MDAGDWVLCPYGPADEQVGQVTAIGTGASSGLLVFRLLSGRCTGAHVSNVQLLPPRPRPDQLPPGKRLTGECRVTTEKDQWAVYYEPGTTKIWDIRGPGLSAHPEPFHGHRWIVEDVPAEAPEPSQPPDLAQALLGARGMLGALSDLARKRGLSSVVQSLGLLIGQDDSARR